MSARRFSWLWVWLLVLCAAPVILVSLTQDIGAHAYDAASEHILRGVAFSSVISEGVLYPRWTKLLHWGLGSPLFTFQPPLPYYSMDVLYRLGLPHSLGWRVLVAAGFALAFVGAYLLVREITGRRWPALVAAAAYLYAPYVVRNAIERGSNEAYSVFLYPLVLWSLIAVARRPAVWRFLLGVLLWGACIASHVLGPLILAPFAAALALGLAWRYRTVAPIAVLLAGGLLTAFIWLPMGPEQAWVHVERDFTQPEAIPAQNPIQLADLVAPPAIYDVARDDNGTGDRVGLIHSVLLLAGLAVAPVYWRRNRTLAVALLVAGLCGAFLFFLLTPWSDWLWRLGGSAAAHLLYRTRLMGAQALASAMVAGLLVAGLPLRWQRWASAFLVALLVLVAIPSLYVQYQHAYASFVPPLDATDVRAIEVRHGGSALTAFGEFEPAWRTAPFEDALVRELGDNFDSAAQPLVNPPDQITVLSARVDNQAWALDLNSSQSVTATLRLLYYPRWLAELDGKPRQLLPEPGTGYAQVRIPAGHHRLTLRYARTRIEVAGFILSSLTLAALCFAALYGITRRRTGRSKVTATRQRTEQSSGWAVVILLGLTGLLVFKFGYLDTQTTAFRCASTLERICGATEAIDAPFIGAHRLRGYALYSTTVKVAGEVHLRLYWEGQPGVPRGLATFVHIRNASPDQAPSPYSQYGIWAQQEKRAWGVLLSSEFVPGKLYVDDYTLRLPPDMASGSYYLEVGWFDPATGEQFDVLPDAIHPPLRLLWRSVLLPDLQVVLQ